MPPKGEGIGRLAEAVGKEGTLTTQEGLRIRVKILDLRQAYGRAEYQVVPIDGEGRAWVTAKRVRLKR